MSLHRNGLALSAARASRGKLANAAAASMSRPSCVGLAEISVKPTQLGLDIDAAAAFANLPRLARAADKANPFLWSDMEGGAYTDPPPDPDRGLRAQGPQGGVAL